MRILLTGANGQLGQALQASLAPLGTVLPATRDGRLPGGRTAEVADLSRPETLPALVARLSPDRVVNAAAYTAVDRAEDEAGLAFRVNAEAPGALSRACAAAGIPLLHFSTDYVFDGRAQCPLREDDPTGPLGVYGASKLAGEQAVREGGAQHAIFRLCWVYGPAGHNFLLTMLRLARERGHLRVVDDQRGTPTSALCIARAVARVLGRDGWRSGTWHLSAGGQCSWHGFAAAIFEGAVARGLLPVPPVLEAVPGSAYPTRAQRPAWSVLDNAAFTREFGFHIGDWREGLDEVLDLLAQA